MLAVTSTPEDFNVHSRSRATGLKESYSYSVSEKSFLHESGPVDCNVMLMSTRSWKQPLVSRTGMFFSHILNPLSLALGNCRLFSPKVMEVSAQTYPLLKADSQLLVTTAISLLIHGAGLAAFSY